VLKKIGCSFSVTPIYCPNLLLQSTLTDYIHAHTRTHTHTQLDLPVYPSAEVLKAKLMMAIQEGAEGFGFA
jgi:hypothetical protein